MDSREADTRIHSSPSSRRTFSWVPLSIICACMVANYFMVTSIYPYAGFMVMRLTGISSDRAGFEAGWLGGSLALGRVTTTFFWGWAVDHFGRKPVLLWCMTVTATLAIAFGTAETLSWAITIRLLQGVLTGTVCVSRVLVAELAGEEHVVAAMAMLVGVANLGMSVGPAIGGLCAEPARHYPSVFSSTGLFGRYPFLLPNLIQSAVASLCIPLVIFLVPETRKPTRGRLCRRRGRYTRAGKEELGQENEGTVRLSGTDVKYEALPDPAEGGTSMVNPKPITLGGGSDERGDGGGSDPEPSAPSCGAEGGQNGIQEANTTVSAKEQRPVPPLDMQNGTADEERDSSEARIFGKGGLLSQPIIRLAFIMGFLFSAVSFGFDEVYPLWAISSHKAGGLEWDTLQVGGVLALGGASVALYQVFVYPWLADKMGIVTAQHVASALACVLLLTIPNTSYLGYSQGFLIATLAILTALTMCFLVTIEVGLSLVTTNPVPPRLRGKMNGLYLTCYYAGSISPLLWGIGFAWSISSGTSVPLVDHRLLFNSSAALIVIVTLLGLKVFNVETMTLVAEDAPSTPLSIQGFGMMSPRSVIRTPRRHFPSPAVSNAQRGDLV